MEAETSRFNVSLCEEELHRFTQDRKSQDFIFRTRERIKDRMVKARVKNRAVLNFFKIVMPWFLIFKIEIIVFTI